MVVAPRLADILRCVILLGQVQTLQKIILSLQGVVLEMVEKPIIRSIVFSPVWLIPDT